MSSYEGMDTTDAGIDLWRVQLATGEVRAMSLEALDDAFQSGLISESTPVLPPGATVWTKLAAAAGLDSGGSPDGESTLPSVTPLAISLSESTGDATPYARSSGLPDIDIDALNDEAFKPRRGRLFVGIGLAVVLVGGLGLAATRLGDVAASAQSSLSAKSHEPAAAAGPHVAVDLDEAFPAAQLTEEQKARLAEADKAREAREAAKRKDRPAGPAGGPRAPQDKSAPFVNGGNKYDPLNGAL